jgi:hypothetical protein
MQVATIVYRTKKHRRKKHNAAKNNAATKEKQQRGMQGKVIFKINSRRVQT